MTNFRIINKEEFLVTYAHDFFGTLTCQGIKCFFIDKYGEDMWDYIIAKEKGPINGEFHEHFHCYLKYKGPNKRGFCCRGKKAQTVWNVPLSEKIVKVFSIENDPENVYYEKLNDISFPRNDASEWTKISNGVTAKYGFCDWKLIEDAHPNIKFKGDDLNTKDTQAMIEYVTKQPLEIVSNFDWEKKLQDLKNETETVTSEKSKSKKDEKEYEFCYWLREKILNTHLTRDEIQKEIVENKEWNYLFLSKHYNYKSVLDAFFKAKPAIKPDPYWGIFYVPKKLYDYLIYLDSFIETWYTNPKQCPKRPKSCFVSGMGDCGKTSLFMAFGDCCYWCNMWNYDNYESKPAFNLMDDYDGSYDCKGNETNNNFYFLKPWFAGQQVVTISGKFKKQTTVVNGRPLVFVSNYKFLDRFNNEQDIQYLKDIGCIVVDIPKGYTLKEYPNTTDIKILSMNWVPYDTRNTWWYKNKVLPTLNQVETQNSFGIDDELVEFLDRISSQTPIHLLDSEDEEQGRPIKKRKVSRRKSY